MNKSKSFFNSHISFLILSILVVVLAYSIGVSQLSFYGDDWIYIYNYHIAGPGSFDLFQRTDRPHSAWVYLLTTFLFGETPLAYHLFLLLLRWLTVYLFRQVLTKAFGKHRSVDAAALLFAVYPGFQQQPIAVEFVMHFASLVLVLFSLWLMQTGSTLPTKKSVPLLILSLLTGGLAIFTCEYFIGLELVRPLILYFTLQQNSDNTQKISLLKKTSIYLIPFICLTVFYFIWRIFIFSFTSYAPKLLIALKENPVSGLRQLYIKVIQDLSTVLFRAYRLIFTRPADISIIAAAAILLSVTAAVFLVLFRSSHSSDTNTNLRMLLFGTILLLLSGIPYWGTFLDVSVDFPWDRSALSFSAGAAIIIAVLLNLILKPASFCAAAALVTSLSVLFHVQNTQIYIKEAEKMNDYFWQLAWRVPGLEEGTILATEAFPLDRTSDNDLSPVVNWQYAPDARGLNYHYKYFDLDLREDFFYADPDTPAPVEHTYRSHSFSSNTGKTLGIFYRKNGCLQIIDESNIGYPALPESLIHIAKLSDPGLIQIDPETPAVPPAPIGEEGAHNYCWYFQKTTLAQQSGQTDAAYEFAAEALKMDLHPTYASDLAPLVLAFLQSADYESAETMLDENRIGSSDWNYLCEFWKNHNSDTTPEMEQFYSKHNCR